MKREKSNATLVEMWKRFGPFAAGCLFAIAFMATSYVMGGRLFPATGLFGLPAWTVLLGVVTLMVLTGYLTNRRNLEDRNGDV